MVIGGIVYRIIIAGSRTITDYKYVFRVLDKMLLPHRGSIDCIISGCARGIDSLAIEWGQKNGVKVEEFPADWKTHGKKAGPIRNQQMLTEGKANALIAFQDVRENPNGSNGTNHMIRISKAKGINVTVIRYGDK